MPEAFYGDRLASRGACLKQDYKSRYLALRGLITVPGAIALAIWLSAIPLLWIDHAFDWPQFAKPEIFSGMSVETARNVLGTIAAAAITTLSLVYSLVLIVFTLAAGTIAPRLLKRFTSDRANQITAGMLGGTFLFALTVLYRTGPGFVPSISIAVSMLLAVVFVLQLIFFVHAVSRSVTIDEEIAEISRRLENRIAWMVRDEEEQANAQSSPGDFDHAIASTQSGYLNGVDENSLAVLARKHDFTVRLRFKPGDFILETQTVALLSRHPEQEEDEIAGLVRQCLLILPSRDAVDEIEYSINLLIEIALRALSPGVNDTFTAIASLDRMTSALSAAVRLGLRRRDIVDSDGTVRVEMRGLGLENMLDSAFHPLRRASADNMLMMEHLAQALSRLHEIGNQTARELISSHAELLLKSAKSSNPLDSDFAALKQLMPFMESGE